jgi:SAM-dependent methyltransferase
VIKQLVRNIFSAFGLEVRKKIHAPLSNPVDYNSRENTDKFYADERLVSIYEDKKRISFYKSIVQQVSQRIDLNIVRSVADASAGTGRLLAEFRKSFPDKKYSGFEFSDAALALCKKNNPGIEFEKADLYHETGKSFDLVLCVDTLEHLEFPGKAVRTLLSMTHPGGYLYLVVPNGRHDTFEGHIHYWSPESFRLFIESLDCPVVSSHVWNEFGEQSVLIGVRQNAQPLPL